MKREQEPFNVRDPRDAFATMREKSTRDVLNLTLKKGRLGTYKAEDVEAYCKAMQGQFNSTESTYNEYVKSLYRQIDKLRAELDTQSGEQGSADQSRAAAVAAEATAKLQAAKQEKQNLVRQLAEVQKQATTLRDQINAQAREIKALRESNLSLQAKLAQKSVQSAAPANRAELDDMRKKLETLRGREQLLSKELELARTQLSAPNAQLSDARTQLAVAHTQLAETHLQLSQARTQLEEAHAQLESLRAENTAHVSAYNVLSAEMSKRQSDYAALSERVAEMQRINDMLYAKNKMLNNSIEAAAVEKANNMLNSGAFRSRVSTAQTAEIEQLRAQNKTLETDKNAALKLAQEREAALLAQKSLLDEQSVRFSQLLAQTQEQGERIAMQDKALSDLRGQISLLTNQSGAFGSPLGARRDPQTEALLSALQSDNTALSDSVRMLTEQKADMLRQLDTIRETFRNALRIRGEEQLSDAHLLQLIDVERARMEQVVRQSWKTGLWSELNSVMM